MKYRLIIISLLLSLVFLTACNSKWDQSDPRMPEKLIQIHNQKISESKEILKKDSENSEALFELGFRYQQLGDFKKAEKYYLKVLSLGPNNFQALNNIVDIYETVNKIEDAAKYVKKLYETMPDLPEAIKDTVRILLKADDPESAELALENFATLKANDSDPQMQILISDLYNQIFKYRQEHGKK